MCNIKYHISLHISLTWFIRKVEKQQQNSVYILATVKQFYNYTDNRDCFHAEK